MFVSFCLLALISTYGFAVLSLVCKHLFYSVISPSTMRRTILFLAFVRTVIVLENLPGNRPLPL